MTPRLRRQESRDTSGPPSATAAVRTPMLPRSVASAPLSDRSALLLP